MIGPVDATGNESSGRKKFLRAFRNDDKGVISVMAAFTLVIVIAIAALVTDAGSLLLTRRSLQNATDAAALAAVQDMTNGQTAARNVLDANNFSGATIDDLSPGTYSPVETLSAGNRFSVAASASDPGVNAVLVRTTAQANTYFSRVFGIANHLPVHAKALATQISVASFSAGTRTASLDNGVANAVLGAVLGTTLSLSAVDYDALASTRIDALTYLNKLATHVGTVSTYDALVSEQVSISTMLLAASEVIVDGNGISGSDTAGAISALNSLSALVPSSATVIPANFLSVSDLAGRTIGSIEGVGHDGLKLDVYDLLAGAARAYGTGKSIDITSGLSIPITNTSVTAKIAIGAPMTTAVDAKVGTSIHTAQTRVALDLKLLNVSIPLVLSTTVDIPIFIDAASGTATVTAIPCHSADMVDLHGTTGLVTAQLGDASGSLSDFSTTPNPPNPAIANLQVLFLSVPVIAQGSSNIGSSEGDATFSQNDIDTQAVHTIGGATDGVLFSDLLSSLQLSVAGATVPTALTDSVTAALGALDPVLTTLLRTLGIHLGDLDTIVNGAKCGVPMLVE